jgi:hypothetical protein
VGYTPNVDKLNEDAQLTIKGVYNLTGRKCDTCPSSIPSELVEITRVFRLLKLGVSLRDQGFEKPSLRLIQSLDEIQNGINQSQAYEFEKIEKERTKQKTHEHD